MEEQEYIITVFSENKVGLLNQITTVFTSRDVNIESLTTSESALAGIHKFTIVVRTGPERVDKLVRQIGREVRQGNIDADPCCHNEEDSYCQYCDWAPACHFQDGRDGDHLRYILPVKPEEFWDELEREDEEGGEK